MTDAPIPHDGRVEKFFGDAPYIFRLTIDDLGDLEVAANTGAIALFESMLARTITTAQMREVIRIGLIGGGMTREDAFIKVRRWFQPPLFEMYGIVHDVLKAAMIPKERLPEPKKEEAEETLADSPSQTSTATARRSGSRRKKSDG